MSQLPAELKYASTHEWLQLDGDIATVGITDHAQDSLGDVVYVELPDVGAQLHAGDEAAVVESVKAASDIFSPVSGEVLEINEELEDSPELINGDPYGDGWFYRIRISDEAELENLLDAEGYSETLEED